MFPVLRPDHKKTYACSELRIEMQDQSLQSKSDRSSFISIFNYPFKHGIWAWRVRLQIDYVARVGLLVYVLQHPISVKEVSTKHLEGRVVAVYLYVGR